MVFTKAHQEVSGQREFPRKTAKKQNPGELVFTKASLEVSGHREFPRKTVKKQNPGDLVFTKAHQEVSEQREFPRQTAKQQIPGELVFTKASLKDSGHREFPRKIVKTRSPGEFAPCLQRAAAFLLYILQCLIQGDLLDPVDIDQHSDQITDEYKEEHLKVPHRLDVELEETAGSLHHLLPQSLHGIGT